jgi:hypothetical protein
MTTIVIPHEASKDAVKRVRKILNEEALRNPNWNGADFRIRRGDFLDVRGRDEIASTVLYGKIAAAIDGREPIDFDDDE